MSSRLVHFILFAAAFSCFAATAAAQTGPALMLKPWADGEEHVELNAAGMIEAKGHTDADHDFRLDRYSSSGRARLDPSADHGPTFGYDFDDINLHTSDPALPARLVDQSFGFGMGLAKIGDWKFGADVGIGYAGNNPFDDSDALYALGDLIFSTDLDEESSLTVTLNYNGNRTIFPDIPIPTISYSRKVSDTFSFTAGVPFSSITWQPLEHLRLDVDYLVPVNFNAAVSYEFIKDWSVIGSFYNRYNAFTIDNAPENRRLFFQQRQVELGVRWQPFTFFEISVAGGYAFGQKFETGFDVRDTYTLRKASDEPYVRVAATVAF